MIAGIDQQADIAVYLKNGEMESLSKGGVVAGILTRIHKPESQGTINVQVDDDKKNINGCIGIGVDDDNYWGIMNNFQINIFIGDFFFDMLQRQGQTGTRQSMLDGSKIDIYNNNLIAIQTLEIYRDNKKRYQQISNFPR